MGNKLDRGYDRLPHVTGKPFMIAIADFQAPASMLWSREGLIGYLYGEGAQVADTVAGRSVGRACDPSVRTISFPGRAVRQRRHGAVGSDLLHACSIAKLNRVAISGRGAPEGLRYTRIGNFFDRTRERSKAFRSAST